MLAIAAIYRILLCVALTTVWFEKFTGQGGAGRSCQLSAISRHKQREGSRVACGAAPRAPASVQALLVVVPIVLPIPVAIAFTFAIAFAFTFTFAFAVTVAIPIAGDDVVAIARTGVDRDAT